MDQVVLGQGGLQRKGIGTRAVGAGARDAGAGEGQTVALEATPLLQRWAGHWEDVIQLLELAHSDGGTQLRTP